MEKVGDDKLGSLKVKITQVSQLKEEWFDTYSKIGIYETRCRGWRLRGSNLENQDTGYCNFNTYTGNMLFGNKTAGLSVSGPDDVKSSNVV